MPDLKSSSIQNPNHLVNQIFGLDDKKMGSFHKPTGLNQTTNLEFFNFFLTRLLSAKFNMVCYLNGNLNTRLF